MLSRRGVLFGGVAALAATGVLPLLGGAAGADPVPSVVNSPVWAGYAETATTAVLTATVSVPALNCTGVPGTLTDSLSMQTGGSSGEGGYVVVSLECNSGVATYAGTYGIGNSVQRFLPFTPAAGDKINGRITTDTSGTVTVKVTDVTQALSGSWSASDPGTDSQAWLLFRGAPPIISFSKLSWTGVKVNGASISGDNPTSYTLVNSSNATLVSTSALNSTGFGFTNKFMASN